MTDCHSANTTFICEIYRTWLNLNKKKWMALRWLKSSYLINRSVSCPKLLYLRKKRKVNKKPYDSGQLSSLTNFFRGGEKWNYYNPIDDGQMIVTTESTPLWLKYCLLFGFIYTWINNKLLRSIVIFYRPFHDRTSEKFNDTPEGGFNNCRRRWG